MRVLLVDDHPVMRYALKQLFAFAGEGIEVAGEAATAGEAVRLAEELGPDVVVLDLRLGSGGSGVEACRGIKALPDAPRVLVLTAHTAREDVAAVMMAGADGCVHKGLRHQEIPDAVRRVHAGERVWLLGEHEVPAAYEPAGDHLTPKEREVLGLIRRRYSNAEIAEELYISLNTVKHHVTRILKKHGKKRRTDLL